MALLVCFVAMIGASYNALAQPAEFAFTPTNASGTFYGQVTVNGAPANANDWLAAFDDWGNCAGASQVVMNDGVAYINFADLRGRHDHLHGRRRHHRGRAIHLEPLARGVRQHPHLSRVRRHHFV